MKHPFDFSQSDLEELATKADDLCAWLEEEPVQCAIQEKGGRIRLPSQLTILTATSLMYATIFLDPLIPDSMCWLGGCTL